RWRSLPRLPSVALCSVPACSPTGSHGRPSLGTSGGWRYYLRSTLAAARATTRCSTTSCRCSSASGSSVRVLAQSETPLASPRRPDRPMSSAFVTGLVASARNLVEELRKKGGRVMDEAKRKEPTPAEPPEVGEPEPKPEPKPEGDLDS